MDNINISTLNVRGFNRKSKVSFVYDFLLKYNIDILFIQETHVRDLNIIGFIKNTFNDYDFFFKATEENSRGVAIFVKKSDKVFINNEFFDNENRMYGIDVKISGFQFNLINIYSPNSPTSQNEFIETLHKILSGKKNIILGGDFNFMEDRVTERKNLVKNWHALYRNFNLCEFEWCVKNLKIKDSKTWSNGHQSSRIDRFYCDSSLSKMCSYENIYETSLSDHKLVVCKVQFNEKSEKKKKISLWKLNESILEYEYVHEKILAECKNIPTLIKIHKKNGMMFLLIECPIF
jgi:hypothetical protein